MKSKEEFIRHFDEWLFKELLLAYHAHHDQEWLVRCSKTLPDKVTKALEKMYDFIADTSDATPSTTKPSGGNGQAGTKTVSAALPASGSKLTTSSGLGGATKPATS